LGVSAESSSGSSEAFSYLCIRGLVEDLGLRAFLRAFEAAAAATRGSFVFALVFALIV
jgi:hypothetical protein